MVSQARLLPAVSPGSLNRERDAVVAGKLEENDAGKLEM